MPGAGRGARTTDRPDGPLVGREAVLAELDVAADAAAGGHGALVLLTGEAGIGKTSVARAVADRSADRLLASWGACRAERSAPPFGPWRSLVDVEASAGPGPADPSPGAPRRDHLSVLDDLVVRAARATPRLHVIEDLQWADVASLLLLADLGATVAEVPLLLVATLRTGEPVADQREGALADVRRVAQVRRLLPLDDGDVAELIGRLGHPTDARLTRLVQDRTGGNPLFVTELVRAAPVVGSRRRQLDVIATAVPERIGDVVLHRLARLPASLAEVLTVASVVGASGDTATLAAVGGRDEVDLVGLLDRGRVAHLLDDAPPGQWRFRHQIIRDAIYDRAGAIERARLHARLVDVLAGHPEAAVSVLAHHALAAQPLLDADRAVALAARAGEAALGQHAYEEADEWFTRALAAAPREAPDRWRAELLVRSGEARRHTGDLDGARRAFLAAAHRTDDPTLLARAALGYADPGADLGIAYRSEDAATLELLERAIAVQPVADSEVAVRLGVRLAAELYFSDDPARARALADTALAHAHRAGDTLALGAASALVHDAFVVGQADPAVQLAGSARLLEWAGASGSVGARLTAHRARVLDLLAAGDLDAMDAEVLAFVRLAEPLRMPAYRWWPALWSAMRALLEGRHAAAEERAAAAYELGASSFPSLAFSNWSFLLFFLRREQGRLAEMEQATRDYATTRADIPALRVALTFLLAEIGRHEEAAAVLAGFDEAALGRLRDRNWPATWFQLARSAWLVGDRELAARLLEPHHRPGERCIQVSLATVCLGATDLGAAWLWHAVGDLDAADFHYRAAADLDARIGARSWLAQTQADHARLLDERAAAGDLDRAARLRAVAAATAEELGLAVVASAVGPSGGAREGPAAGAAVRDRASLRREGPVWAVTFAGRAVRLPDARGLRDLAHLLGRPGEAVSVLDLADDVVRRDATARGAEALDERARREIREHLHRLDEAEAAAEAAGDGERAALVREERQVLAESVARDVGLGGRSRRIGDPVERARKTVSTRIRRTIAAVARVHPELGRHLERSIDTGTWCAYRPAEPVDWEL